MELKNSTVVFSQKTIKPGAIGVSECRNWSELVVCAACANHGRSLRVQTTQNCTEGQQKEPLDGSVMATKVLPASGWVERPGKKQLETCGFPAALAQCQYTTLTQSCNMAMNFDREPPLKWLVDRNPHLNDVHQRIPL